ncbi:anoctamin-8 [Aplysia californica]|uniref:Anoctamin n=1 Tax=Aplysia californica TaxID=6500 RepID=A0ABM0JM40_APLCA|nr:anoctamin-8 [Aplysia californica]
MRLNMFAEERDERRSDRQREGNSYSSLRNRIPYRLLGRRSLGAKRLVVSSKVLLPAIPTENCDVVLTFPANTEDATLMWLLARFKSRAPAITVHVRHHSHTGIYGFYLTAPYDNLLQGAEEIGLLKPLKSEYGGGMKEFIYEDHDCFAGIEDEGTFLTSQERQSIVLHFLHELRATGDDSLAGINFVEGQAIVPLLITKKVVWQVFPLHSNQDLKELRKNWVQAIFSTQPLDLVCRYFGVKIGLYFAYLGHYTTWLLLPTLIGILIFLFQGSSQFAEDLCFVGFALFNVVWATLYIKFWKRASTEYCYRWGTLEKKDEMLKDPRPLFTGDLVKSPVTGHLELHYPAWKRLLFRYCITMPVIGLCLVLVFVFMLLCFELQELVNELIGEEELPYVFSFVPKVLLAVVVSIFDEVYKQIAIWLTHKENYRLEESYETSLVIKMILFQFVNSFLSLFYIGIYLSDMDRLRDQLAALLITRQVLGNLKEAFMPYVVWKARLYSVGYRMATRMSPASVEKEVKRMTARSRRVDSTASKAAKAKDHQKKKNADGAKSSDSESSLLTEEEDDGLPTLTQAEVESAMRKYEDTLDDFLEMSIQFGYITLFSPAFPLAALCALLNNIIEIRSDAFKLCLNHQRPFGRRVDSIGIWQDVLVVISILAIIVNCALVGTSGLLQRMYPGLSTTVYFLIIVIIEHLIIAMKVALSRSIPDLPPTVATEMARLEYQRTEALKQLVLQATPNQVGGNLLSHYSGSPNLRRKKTSESVSSEQSSREDSPPVKTSAAPKNFSAPTVITPTSSTPRPADIPLAASSTPASSSPHIMRPKIPPRSSLQTSTSSTSSNPFLTNVSSTHSDVAEKVVAAAMHPMFDYSDITSSSNSSSRLMPPPPPPPPPSASGASLSTASPLSRRTHAYPPIKSDSGNSGVVRKLVRSRAELEVRRRRSEPVSSAVTEALNAQQRAGDDSGLQRKSIYENREDLSQREESKKQLNSTALRADIRKSREKLNYTLEDVSEKHKKRSESPVLFAPKANASRLAAGLTSLPPSIPASSSALSSHHRYCHSPRLLRGGALGDPSPLALKVLTRKSRSFSSADVTEARQAFRDRMSWRGELPVVGRAVVSEKSPLSVDSKKEKSEETEVEKIKSSSEFGKKFDESSRVEMSSRETGETGSRKEVNESSVNVEAEPRVSEILNKDIQEGESDKEGDKRKRVPSKERSDSRFTFFNRAVRENASKPLSISPHRGESKKEKK